MSGTGEQDDGALRVTLRVDFPGGRRIGPGKIALLEAVDRTGSISAGGRALGMSYRRAWMLLDALNGMFDTPVVTASSGGAGGGGAVVTAFGQDLVRAYRAVEAETERLARERLAETAERAIRGRPATGSAP